MWPCPRMCGNRRSLRRPRLTSAPLRKRPGVLREIWTAPVRQLRRGEKGRFWWWGKGTSPCGEAVERLADVWGAGIVMAQQAKGLLPDEHPRVLGGVGEAYLPAALHEADCVLK